MKPRRCRFPATRQLGPGDYAEGLILATHHTVESALALAADWSPDAAVLDIGLPDASGNELARRLRKEPEGRDMLLVAVTGWGQDQDRVLTSEAGFDSHLVKPVDPQQVRDVIAGFTVRRADRGTLMRAARL